MSRPVLGTTDAKGLRQGSCKCGPLLGSWSQGLSLGMGRGSGSGMRGRLTIGCMTSQLPSAHPFRLVNVHAILSIKWPDCHSFRGTAQPSREHLLYSQSRSRLPTLLDLAGKRDGPRWWGLTSLFFLLLNSGAFPSQGRKGSQKEKGRNGRAGTCWFRFPVPEIPP